MAKKNAQASVIIADRQPEKPQEIQQDNNEYLEICALDLLKAIQDKDIKAMAVALRSLFEEMDSQPHEEGPHTYEAQNIKAGQER